MSTTTLSLSELQNETQQMVRDLPDNLRNQLFLKAATHKMLLVLPLEYIKELKTSKDVLGILFQMIVRKGGEKEKEYYERFIPAIHEILIKDLEQIPQAGSKSQAQEIPFLNDLYESAESDAQTRDPQSVYNSLYYFVPRIDEGLAAIGQGDRIMARQANTPTNNNNNNGRANSSGPANRSGRSGAGSGGGKKRKTRRRRSKSKKYRKN